MLTPHESFARRPYLQNAQEHHVCITTIDVVSEIARALNRKLSAENGRALCGDIMHALLHNLQDPLIERSVKPHIISCLSDIALAVGGYFERYFPLVMRMLVQESHIRLDQSDYDNHDYINQLHEAHPRTPIHTHIHPHTRACAHTHTHTHRRAHMTHTHIHTHVHARRRCWRPTRAYCWGWRAITESTYSCRSAPPCSPCSISSPVTPLARTRWCTPRWVLCSTSPRASATSWVQSSRGLR
jgi:hypothetical protein